LVSFESVALITRKAPERSPGLYLFGTWRIFFFLASSFSSFVSVGLITVTFAPALRRLPAAYYKAGF
jgi:hypothetical protein